VRNRKIIICSSMVINVCITWEYRTTIHTDARLDQKASIVDILWCMETYTRDTTYVNNEIAM